MLVFDCLIVIQPLNSKLKQEAVLNDVLSVGGGKYLVACYMLHARETLSRIANTPMTLNSILKTPTPHPNP